MTPLDCRHDRSEYQAALRHLSRCEDAGLAEDDPRMMRAWARLGVLHDGPTLARLLDRATALRTLRRSHVPFVLLVCSEDADGERGVLVESRVPPELADQVLAGLQELRERGLRV
jgi:hypothetical protein